MAGFAKITLIGNLGQDPEMRYTPDGKPVANFSVAYNSKYTKADGSQVETTQWYRVQAWNKLAEICSQYLQKGMQVFVQGSLRLSKWQGREGQEMVDLVVTADQMVMLGSRPQNGAREGQESGAVDDQIPF